MQTTNHRLCSGAGLLISALCLTAQSASAAVIVSSEDFVVRRNAGIGAATVENSFLHPKLDTTAPANNRFGIIRFDSADFGSGVTAATFQITASSDAGTLYTTGTASFTLWGVIDGDAQDEAVTTAGYLPNAAGTLFDNSADLVDNAQLVNLGSFSASTGATINFNPASLLSFIQNDTNDIVTFAITRDTDNQLNSVLLDNTSLTPPTLTITSIPEPASLSLLGLGGLLLARRRRN